MSFQQDVSLMNIARRWVLQATAAGFWAVCSHVSAQPAALPSDLDAHTLLSIHQDRKRPHEAPPLGVPRDFSWARFPDMPSTGNSPKAGYKAATGWGQVFHSPDSYDPSRHIQIRNFQVLLCVGTNRDWVLVQQGGLAGGQFRADYKDNLNKGPIKIQREGDTTTLAFEKGSAYHFWPQQGRFALPGGDLCGWLVLLQARVDGPSTKDGGFLIGLGADYWTTLTAPWDNYKTNDGVGNGRLRLVGTEWQWYGMSTATEADLVHLRRSGYRNLVNSPKGQ
jgi:hypothetical protein